MEDLIIKIVVYIIMTIVLGGGSVFIVFALISVLVILWESATKKWFLSAQTLISFFNFLAFVLEQ